MVPNSFSYTKDERCGFAPSHLMEPYDSSCAQKRDIRPRERKRKNVVLRLIFKSNERFTLVLSPSDPGEEAVHTDIVYVYRIKWTYMTDVRSHIHPHVTYIYIHILMQGNIAIMCDYASLTKTKKTLHMYRRSLREMSIV